MEKHREEAVWQRVMAPAQGNSDFAPLVQQSADLAARYGRLGADLSGRGGKLARQLEQEQQRITQCLIGLVRLSGGAVEQVTPWLPRQQDLRALLRLCYHSTRQAQTEYLSRALDPLMGDVFRQLADMASMQSFRLAQLLGIALPSG